MRESISSHWWISKDNDQREEHSRTKVVTRTFCTHMQVSKETGTNICGYEKGKARTTMGQRMKSRGCIGTHSSTRPYKSIGVSRFVYSV